MSGPPGVRRDKRAYQRPELLGSRGVNSEQNNTGSFQGASALNGNLPEVLGESHRDARFGFRHIQQDDVLPSGEIGAGPHDIVAVGAKGLDDWPR